MLAEVQLYDAFLVKKKKLPTKVPKLIHLPPEAVALLEQEKARSGGRPVAHIILDRIMGRGRFAPDVEEWLTLKARKSGLSREVALERILIEAMVLSSPAGKGDAGHHA